MIQKPPFYRDRVSDNEPTDGERRLYKVTAILIGSLLVAVAIAFAVLYELA